LRAQGEPTVGERREMLVKHRDAVVEQIAQLHNNLAAIVDKIAYYEAAERTVTRQVDQPQSDLDSSWNTHKPNATRGAGTS
jgi:hypothetical protein